MKDDVKMEMLKEIVEKQLKEVQRKQKIMDEISGINAKIEKAILENDRKIDLRELLNRELKLISDRKGSGGTIRRLQAILVDIILEKGRYNSDQLTLDEMLRKPKNKKEVSGGKRK